MNRLLAAVVVLLLALGLCLNRCQAEVIADWNFDEGEGGVLHDSGPNHLDGALTSGPVWVPGVSGTALSFNGSNYVDIPNSSSYNLASGFTLSAWAKLEVTNTNSTNTILSKHVGSVQAGYSLGTDDYNRFRMYLNGDGISTSGTYNDGQWHHLVGSYDGSTLSFYVDNQKIGQKAVTYNHFTPTNIKIGGAFMNTGEFIGFDGAIDNVQMWTFNNSHGYKPQPITPSPTDPTDHLAKWNWKENKWDPVADPGTISGNVHVLVHGWGPKQLSIVNNSGGSNARVWNPEFSTYFEPFTNLAQAITSKTNAADTVLAYSWIDQSATDHEFSLDPHDLFGYVDACESRSRAPDMGGLLKDQLKSAIGSGAANLHLIGHSHGALVVTEAASQLKDDHIPVTQVSLLDSPEGVLWASNGLAPLLQELGVGKNVADRETFVDNYHSLVGRDYNGNGNPYGNWLGLTVENVIDVDLGRPLDFLTPAESHNYPIKWYGERSTNTTATTGALWWSPLVDDSYKTLDSYKYRLTASGDLEAVFDPIATLGTRSPMSFLTIHQDTNVTDSVNGMKLFTKNSPAYWDSLFVKADDDVAMQFTYEFIQPGQGDQLGIWIDDQLRFVVTGELAGTGLQTGVIDLSGLAPGSHAMTVAMHDYGTEPAQFSIGDFTMLSVPEPSTFVLLGICVISLLIHTWRRRKRS